MQVQKTCAGLPFKAQVESSNPLISGDWRYLHEPSSNQNQTVPQKESHWFRNTILTLAVLGLAAWGLIKGKNSEAVQNIINKEATTVKDKVLKFLGGSVNKLGGWAEAGWSKLTGLFAKKA